MKSGQRQQGFTLIEVLIAITLLTVGILAAASMQISSLGGNSLAIRVTTASTLAGSTIEELMRLNYDHPDLDGTVALDPPATFATTALYSEALNAALNDQANAATWPSATDGFEIFYHVADNYPLVDCKTIRVMVRRDDRGVLRTLTMDFIKMRPMTES